MKPGPKPKRKPADHAMLSPSDPGLYAGLEMIRVPEPDPLLRRLNCHHWDRPRPDIAPELRDALQCQ